MKFKKFILMLTAVVLCLATFTACGDSDKDDSSSGQFVTQGMLDKANSQTGHIYIAIVQYCEKYINRHGNIPDGELTDIEIISVNDSDSVRAPDKAYANIEEATADIQKAVSIAVKDTEDIVGTVFSVKFEKGFPKAIIWANDTDSNVIGGYPNHATEADWTLEKAGQKE